MTPPVTLKTIIAEEKITVTINGIKYDVPTTFSEVSLNQYLREHLQLTGAKVTCREGGCGVCTVHVAYKDPTQPTGEVMIQRSINSCLCPILSCDGWEITTVEGIGNQKQPHPVQSAMTDHYATQCGYCTPGWVMNMYSVLQNTGLGNLSQQDVENACDGNICRCTGYRPILDAFKTFAKNKATTCTGSTADIEDVSKVHCKTTGKKCAGHCRGKATPYIKGLSAAAESVAPPWYKPTKLAELYTLIATLSGRNVYYVVGHTGKGVYDDAPYDAYVDMKGIAELYGTGKTTDGQLTVGANTSLTDLIAIFTSQSATPGFQHLASLAALISKTAHHSVRNFGSWAGNLAMKNRHKEFPSDSFIAFAVANAKLIVGPGDTAYSSEDFLNLDMTGKIIVRADFPNFGDGYVFRTYKIMPRAGNAHAYVNAAFRAKVDRTSQPGQVIIADSEPPAIIFGNISDKFVHASQTETLLKGKNIADPAILQQALTALSKEVIPVEHPAEASVEYKKSLSLSLFYKYALELVGELADVRYRSAVGSLVRPLSSGTQSYPTKPENYPLTQAIPKLESMVQCTGEAKYVSDIEQEGMLHAAFTLTTEGNASIFKVDTADAVAYPGVTRVLVAEDIPGINNVSRLDNTPEELLVSKQSVYAGQPIALVVAISRDIAESAAKLVKVQYYNVQPPILTCKDAIARNSFFPTPKPIIVGDAAKAIASAVTKVEGEIELGTQNHFHMETEVTVAYPTEDGLNIEADTQSLDKSQSSAAQCCGIGKNQINITVKRSGGGFGGKGNKNYVTAGAALAAYLLRRPVKLHLSLWDNLKIKGRRYPYYVKYQAGTDAEGKLVGVVLNVYGNVGASDNDIGPLRAAGSKADNVYYSPNWNVTLHACKTNTPANTFCRAPGSTEAVYFIEHILEHVAHMIKKPSIEVKRLNYYKNGDKLIEGPVINDCTILPITDQLLQSSSYTERTKTVADFNQANRWRKRGINVVPMRFPVHWTGGHFNCLIAIFHAGGTIAVTHGGVELGQGINTKVAQVVALELGVDMKYIAIQPTQAITNANARGTNGSITSELVCLAAIDCCRQLRSRIDAVRGKSNASAKSWEDVIEDCFKAGVDLSARAWLNPITPDPIVYNTFGVMCTEVELDLLTGEFQISRLDLLYDCGESMSPFIDIGQVEGAVVMGIGYFTTEEQFYDTNTGENLTYSTWKYKPPMAKDIPVDFRVALLQNAPNPSGVLRSKVVAEPPLCMTSSVVFALRNAIAAGLAESGKGDLWFDIVTPMSVERNQQYSNTDIAAMRYRDM